MEIKVLSRQSLPHFYDLLILVHLELAPINRIYKGFSILKI